MSTRRKINKILKEKGLVAEVQYDGSGASSMSDKSFRRLIICMVAAVCVIHVWGAFLLEMKK